MEGQHAIWNQDWDHYKFVLILFDLGIRPLLCLQKF